MLKNIGLIIIGILLGIGLIIILMNVGTTTISLQKIEGGCSVDSKNHLLEINAVYKNSGTEPPSGLWAEVIGFDPAVIASTTTPTVTFPLTFTPGSSTRLTFTFVLAAPFTASSTSVIVRYHWYDPIGFLFQEHTRDDTLTCTFPSTI